MMLRKWLIGAVCALALLGGTHAPATAAGPDVPTLLRNAAVRYRINEVRFKRIAWCESRFNPLARSRAGHMGVFQFADRTWRWASAAAGYAGASPFSAQANIYTAAWLMSQPGGYAHWGCR
jgi:soluble lytic murein transglycosylase-like protein